MRRSRASTTTTPYTTRASTGTPASRYIIYNNINNSHTDIYFIYIYISQGPYSESDLGSDYGDGSQTGERGRGSEAGTLASRSFFSSNNYFHQFSIVLLENYVSSSFLWSGTPKDRLRKIEVHKHLTSKAARTHRSVIT